MHVILLLVFLLKVLYYKLQASYCGIMKTKIKSFMFIHVWFDSEVIKQESKNIIKNIGP